MAILIIAAACSAGTQTPTQAPIAVQAEPVLELVKDDQVVSLTMDELKALPAVEGLGGIMSSTGAITAPTKYKGVLVSTLLDKVGGLTEDKSVEIVAEDGYSMTFSPAQILDGDYITYDAATGDEIEPLGKLQTIIAYENEGQPLDEKSEGKLRLVIISDSPLQVVDGHWSVKWVKQIKLKEAVKEWTLELDGAISETMDRSTFESGAAEGCHGLSWKDEEGHEWTGIPLYYLLGRIDDDVKHGDDAYRDDLAKAGYTVDIVSGDGYTVTLDSLTTMRNDNIIVAYLEDGQPISDDNFPLRLVGSDLTKKQMVGGIAKIMINFAPASTPTTAETPTAEAQAVVGPADAKVTLTGLVEAEKTLTMNDLVAMGPVVTTVEHPKKGSMEVTGIPFSKILASVSIKPEAKTVTFVASDGFSVDVPLADLQACESCLLGWDEEMLRTYMPGFESSFWAKDLTTIEFK